METPGDTITARVARLNSEITGKIARKTSNGLVTREGLLDSLQALYDECSIENLQKLDKNIEYFVHTYKKTMENLKKTRINLSDFEIKNCIGRGHFGDVHVVIEKNTRDIYAMKSIRKCDSLDQKKTSFIAERNIMAFTQSPWLTSLQYAFQDATHLFFVMEFHPGGDLLGLLYKQGGTLPESAATFYLAEIILGLQDLHQMGYVHRDIKPDNILLDRCGHVKLADFGSAAKLNPSGFVTDGPPVGTPDYIAPEILQSMENRQGKIVKYGLSCDFWSVGILAYELAIGTAPFSGQNTSTVYSKIMNHTNNLKFPADVVLSQAYVTFIKSLVVDEKNRLSLNQILKHPLFKNVHFDTLRDQVPPFVPKISSFDDTSNFADVPTRKKAPCIDNFKKKTQFSGRNLPFVGFTFTPDNESVESSFDQRKVKDEMVENLKSEVEKLRKKLAKNEGSGKEKENLEKKLEEKSRKLENVESVRSQLEKDVANNIAECAALKRTLELERKDRAELEKKALELIKSAKTKWENEEKRKIDSLNFTIEEQKGKIRQLMDTNKMLDEQVQHALKMEAKHKVSMETVEKLSRRSVIGLESRLDRVTLETQNTISDLQGRLNEQFYQKTALERQISKLKEKESVLNTQLKNSEDNYKNLNCQVDAAEILIRDLEKKVTSLEKESELLDSCRDENQSLKERINDSKKTIKDLENRCTYLEMENKNIETLRIQIEDMNQKMKNMQMELKKITELEVELQKEKEKTKSLNNQIQETQNTISETQELRELRTKYWRMEKELNNLKIDKRILERELKENEAKNKQLQEDIEKLNNKMLEHKKIHESALIEMNSIHDSLSMELMKVKETERSLQAKLSAEQKINEESKNIVAELKALSNGKEEKIRKLTSESELLRKQLGSFEVEKEKLGVNVDIVNKEKMELKNHLEKARRENQNLQMNLEALREACTLLESQVVEYEKLNESFKEKEKVLNSNTEKLIADLCVAKKEIQEAKKLANEEKSYKLIAETKNQRYQEEIESLRGENDAYKQQAKEYREYSNQLSEELTVAEEKITDLEVSGKSFERQLEDFILENRQLKEEVSEYITQLHKCREINYKLKHQVNELKDNKNILINKINELDVLLQEKSSYYKEREIKSEATIKQQIKLIDYLQSKIDDNQSKKKLSPCLDTPRKKILHL
ncbi:hypothetical protein HHI36_021424 [Cryptolaemus montrouzieri]|uniref:non-specific serine/threonine protein kinase n=1 Tax=Cryptolaemus montrouzieri TaxID=559131 RepID=A0ABD2MX83_9CUCU